MGLAKAMVIELPTGWVRKYEGGKTFYYNSQLDTPTLEHPCKAKHSQLVVKERENVQHAAVDLKKNQRKLKEKQEGEKRTKETLVTQDLRECETDQLDDIPKVISGDHSTYLPQQQLSGELLSPDLLVGFFDEEDRRLFDNKKIEAAKIHLEKAAAINGLQILEEQPDEEFDFSEYGITEYAKDMGIDPEKEPELMWIAKESLSARLPTHWVPCYYLVGTSM
ncbi:uncharacterized protein LOC144083226 [Stigmatopora argus]